MLKISLLISLIAIIAKDASAQKVSYEDSWIFVNGSSVARVERDKEPGTIGLIRRYAIYSPKGSKLITATPDLNAMNRPGNNSVIVYAVYFISPGLSMKYSVNALDAEKNIAEFIGRSGVIHNETLDSAKVQQLVDSGGPMPGVTYDGPVRRNHMFTITLKEHRFIYQGEVMIGQYTDLSDSYLDRYEFITPGGTIVAKASFKGNNDAKAVIITTTIDNYTRSVTLATDKKITYYNASSDRNEDVLLRIIRILVEKNYL